MRLLRSAARSRRAQLILALAGVLLVQGCQTCREAAAELPPSPGERPSPLLPGSREFKLLLDGARFGQRQAAFRTLLQQVEQLAGEQWIPLNVRRKKGLKEKQRSVAYLDTPDRLLRAHGLLLRRRVPQEGEADYTLKQRFGESELEAAARRWPGFQSGCPGKPKLEEDVVHDPAAPGGLRRLLSLSCKVRAEEGRETWGRLVRLLPLLQEPKVPEEQLLAPGGGRALDERRVEPLTLRFTGGNKATPLVLSVWLDDAGQPLVGELSFTLQLPRDPAARTKQEAAAQAFFLALASSNRDWLARGGQTKSSFAGDEAPEPASPVQSGGGTP